MEIAYRQAFAEVLEILKYTNRNILKKIPEKFIIFLKENKDNDYIVTIDFFRENWEDGLKQETQAIIALIYRDYIVSTEKKRELIKEDQEEQIRIEKEFRKKYNPDNIFKNKKEESIKENTNLPIEIKKESLLRKFLNFINNLISR